ncbi:FHA domain-containing protein [Cellulomonas sp. zg-B12]|nr:FHA domain-containing protein [Cellulomonas xiejunii]
MLNDAARSLSRVHAEFGPQAATADEDSAIWVADRGSTNGTVVIDPAGTARVLPPGTRALVGAGWTVRLGDREARVESD